MSKTTKELIELAIGGMEPGYTLAEVGDNDASIYIVTTPHLDRHGDHIEIFVREYHGLLMLSDDCYAVEDLRFGGRSFGMLLDNDTQTFWRIERWLSVERSADDELTTVAHPGNLTERIIAMVTAIHLVGKLAGPATEPAA